MENKMYNIYNNFQILKSHNFLKIMADEFLELEKEDDDFIIQDTFPKTIESIIENKLVLKNYNAYIIYILKIKNYNKISDYKKIWGICNFEKGGLYDNYYDVEGGRIYFGIKEYLADNQSHPMLNSLCIYLPNLDRELCEEIFCIYKNMKFDLDENSQRYMQLMYNVYGLNKSSILVHKSTREKLQVEICGENVEHKINSLDLPGKSLVEQILP